jgi:hypothetical protein
MPGLCRAGCNGGGAVNRQALQSALAATVADAIEERGQRAVGRVIGASGQTVGRWGSDLHQWPAAELLTLADTDQHVAAALSARLSGSAPVGRGTDQDARSTLRDAGKTVSDLADALADGHIEDHEKPQLRADVRSLIAALRVLDADLRSKT